MEKVEREIKVGTEGAVIRTWTSGEKQLVTKDGETITRKDIDRKIEKLQKDINFLLECRKKIELETIGSLTTRLLDKMLLK